MDTQSARKSTEVRGHSLFALKSQAMDVQDNRPGYPIQSRQAPEAAGLIAILG
jgi:hypothetical protein